MGFNSGFKGLMVIYTSQKTTSVPKFPSAGLPSRITVFLNFMQFIIDYSNQVGRVAQSVKRLATGWTVRGSNPCGGEIFGTCPDRPWGQPSLLYNGYRVFPGGDKERPGRDADPSPPSSAAGHERVELYLY